MRTELCPAEVAMVTRGADYDTEGFFILLDLISYIDIRMSVLYVSQPRTRLLAASLSHRKNLSLKL